MPHRFSRRRFAAAAVSVPLAAPFNHALAQPATPVSGTASVATAIDALPGIVEEIQGRSGVPGIAVAVVSAGDVLFTGGFGEREVGSSESVDEDTVFQIASISKSVSSTIMSAVLADHGLSWDTPVVDLDPSFALADPWITAHVTLADLFSHRSGLPDHAGDDLEDLGGDRDLVLSRLRHVPLEGRFRDSYAYTNFGLTAAAEALARYLGTTWEDLATETLFAPLGMDATSYRHSDYASRENRALLHVERDGAWRQEFDRQPDAQAPAGGVSGSVHDLARWMRLQLGGGVYDGETLVDPSTLATTHQPHARTSTEPTSGIPGFYGLGWNVSYGADGQIQLGHSGAFALGASTAVNLWPSLGLGIITLTNGAPIGVPEAINVSFGEMARTGATTNDYFALIGPIVTAGVAPAYGDELAAMAADITPPLGAWAYMGTYANDLFGDLVIAGEDDALTMTVGPAGMTFPLAPVNRDVFAYQPSGENAGPPSAVIFTLDATGAASHVRVENLDVYRAGTFVRVNADS